METVEGFKEDEKGKRRASRLSSFELIFRHPCFMSSEFYVLCRFMSSEFFGEVVTSLRGADFWSCVSSAKS